MVCRPGLRAALLLAPLGACLATSGATAQTCSAEVGSLRKISAISGGFGGGLDDDLFGHAEVRVGDLDADGNPELAVTAPADDDGGADQGAVWILFLDASASVVAEQKISATSGGFGGTLAPGARLGYSIAALGDHDGDGVADLAVGAPFAHGTRGSLWILFLDADGTVKAEQEITEGVGGFGALLDPDGRFGGSVTALGDLNGDGIGDLAVGANTDDDGGMDRGAVWILFLDTNGTVKGEQKISATDGGFAGVLANGDELGYSLATLGDLDGDGNADIASGARRSDDGGTDRGAVWILMLHADGTVKAEQELSATSGGFAGALSNGDEFGSSVAALGDLDGDGKIELAVGAPLADDGGPAQGALWLLSLDTDGTVLSEQKISATAGGFTGDLDPADLFGFGLAALGDLDGDGFLDLAVGAPMDDDGGADHGAVWILLLGDDAPPVLHCPPLVFVPTPKGAPPTVQTVNFLVGAVDACDPTPTVVCVPPSGSLFPPGVTPVTCTATDAAGNYSLCIFDVVVRPTYRRP